MKPYLKTVIGIVLALAVSAAAFYLGEHQQKAADRPVFRDLVAKTYDVDDLTQRCSQLQAAYAQAAEQLAACEREKSAERTHFETLLVDLSARLSEAEREKTALELQLPRDNDKWYTTLFLHPHPEQLDGRFRDVQKMALELWEKTDWVQDLKRQTHARVITHDQPEFRPYWGDATHPRIVAQTPCLLIQRANGEVIYQEYGRNLAKLPLGLKVEVQKACRKHCPNGRCHPPAPPAPPAPPNAPIAGPPAVEVPPVLAPKKQEFPALALLASIVAGAVTFYVKLVA